MKDQPSAQDLAEMSQEDFDKLDDDLVKTVVSEERRKLARFERRLKGIKDQSMAIESAETIATALGISRQAVEQYQRRAFLKIKTNFPELRDLLK